MLGQNPLGPVGKLKAASQPMPPGESGSEGISRDAILAILQGGGTPDEQADAILALVNGEESQEPPEMA